MMNPELKQKWLEALRSGKYEQGKGWLAKDNKFCCLGVLCDIAGLEYDDESGARTYRLKDSFARGFLPGAFKEVVNISVQEETDIANFNDDDESFDYIADWIEENL